RSGSLSCELFLEDKAAHHADRFARNPRATKAAMESMAKCYNAKKGEEKHTLILLKVRFTLTLYVISIIYRDGLKFSIHLKAIYCIRWTIMMIGVITLDSSIE